MSNTMKVRWFLIGWCCTMLLAIALATWANAADLPIPKPRPVPEQCVAPDVKPAAGQVMAEDKTCPGGLRWRRDR